MTAAAVGDVAAGGSTGYVEAALTLPQFDAALWTELLPAAALIGLVGFIEWISVAQTLAAKRRERIDAHRELVGLGSANVAAALSGGYPVTGGFARPVVNFDAGARMPLAGVFTAAGIALVALLFTPLFRNLPQAAPAATIIVAGVASSIALCLWRTSRPHIAIVGQVPGTEHFRNVQRHAVLTSPPVLSVRVDASLYFANVRFLEDRLYDEIAHRPGIRHGVLMCPAVNYIDASALDSLQVINARLRQAGVLFHLSEVKGPVLDRLQRSSFLERLSGQVFLSQHQAMAALDAEVTRQADRGAPRASPVPLGADA